MRFLFLTNFYPPVSRGGYEQWCQEVAEGLRARGHDVSVLTSTHGRDSLQSPDPEWVYRNLNLEMEFMPLKNAFQFFFNRQKRETKSLKWLQRITENLRPDAILIWGMWNLPRSIPALAERLLPNRVAYYIGDYWPTLPSQFENYWHTPARNLMTSIPKLVLGPVARQILANEEIPALCFEHTLYPSQFMREELKRQGVMPKKIKIIHGAIDTTQYLSQQMNSRQSEKKSLLFIGRLTHEKGVHTAIEAIARLVHGDALENIHLTIVGNGEPEYVNQLRQLVKMKDVTSFVTFLPAQPKETLPALYREADIFLFTSIWDEPFGRVIVEAMASGVAVVGTAVGGATEILVDNENALIFIPDDPVSLSRQLKRLIESPALYERLTKAGYKTAIDKFDVNRMTTEIEAYLQTLVN